MVGIDSSAFSHDNCTDNNESGESKQDASGGFWYGESWCLAEGGTIPTITIFFGAWEESTMARRAKVDIV